MRAMTLAVALFAALGISLGSASIARAEESKCTIAIKGDSPTKLACDKGGKKEAARQMKSMVKLAKSKGTVFVCDDCHKDNEKYELTDTAKKDFEKLLAAIK